MKRKKRGRKGKIIILCIAVVVLIAAGIFFFVFKGRRTNAMAMASVQAISTTAETGNISTTVVGTGTLQSDTAEDIEIPEGIKIKEVLVESGDKVKQGDVLATLNEASLARQMAEVQEEIAELDEEINEAKDDSSSKYVKTQVAGRVKKIYAQEDTAVAATMGEKGALILLSIDGKMAVKLEGVFNVAAGDEVTVTLSDGDTVDGTVESVDSNGCIVTMSDKGPEYEEKVTVADTDGKKLGSGQLFIHQQLPITGASGTVSSIKIEENESVSAGQSLIKLKDVPASAEYQQLMAEREQLTNELQELTNLSLTNAVTAEFDGTVASVNVTSDSTVKNSTVNGSTTGSSSGSSGNTMGASASADTNAQTVQMVNASTAAKQSSMFTFASTQTEKKDNRTETAVINLSDLGQILQELKVAVPVTGDVPQADIEEKEWYSGTISWSPADSTFFPATVYTAVVELRAKTGYQFLIADQTNAAYTGASQTAWEVAENCEANTLKLTLVFPATQQPESESETTGQSETQPQSETQSQSETQPQSETQSQSETQGETKDTDKKTAGNPSGSSSSGTTGKTGSSSGISGVSTGTGTSGTTGGNTTASSGTSSDSSTSSTETSEDSNYVTAFTVSAEKSMILSVNIDELDILSIQKGQKAVITLDALEGQEFEGELTAISDTASSSGGVTKYSVEVTIPKEESMMTGMNASATITIESKENVILLPADAIQERGDRQFVYTEQDSEEGTLSGEVEIETGISDGSNVEITSGLSEGEIVYYNPVVSEESSSSMEDMMMGGQMMGGQMPDMPSGGFDGQRGGGGGERPSGGYVGQ